MKKHLAVLAATAVLGVTSAFAANPFSDVTPQDWAYQAVAQLAAQGVVNGYPDGTFQGQNNITRYEMAQMVAKAMTRQGQVDAEQNAIINRLANEFSAELNNLGVRVSTLENKVGNFKFTGDARLRYKQLDGDVYNIAVRNGDGLSGEALTKEKEAVKANLKVIEDHETNVATAEKELKDAKEALAKATTETDKKAQTEKVAAAEKKLADETMALDKATTGLFKNASMLDRSKFDYRARINFDATVNKDTKAGIRVVAADKEFGSADSTNVTVDTAYVQHNFGKYATVTAGRHDVAFGAGMTYDDTFDGVTATVGTDALNAGITYGYAAGLGFNAVKGMTSEVVTKDADKKETVMHPAQRFTASIMGEDGKASPELTVLQLNGKVGPVNVGGYYAKVNGHQVDAMLEGQANVLGAFVGVPMEDRPTVGDSLDSYGFHADAMVGKDVKVEGEFARFKDIKHSNAWAAGLSYGHYNMAKAGTWMTKVQYFNYDSYAPIFSTTFVTPFTQNYKAWMVSGKYAIANNVGLAAYATIDSKDKQGHEVPNFVRTEINYKF